MTRGDFAGCYGALAKDKNHRVHVAIRPKDADVQLMVDIAKWGKGPASTTPRIADDPAHLHAGDAAGPPKASLVEQPFKAAAHRAQPRGHGGHQLEAVPPLGGYVATTVKQNAELVLMSHQEIPSSRRALRARRAAPFTRMAKSKWGVLWLRWGDFNKFWAQLTRWTLRSGSRSDTTAIVQRIDQTGEVVVDAWTARASSSTSSLQIGVVAPNRERSVVDLEQIGPGRYRAASRPAGGVYLVGMAQRKASAWLAHSCRLVVPYAQ